SIRSWRRAYHNAWHTCDTCRRCQHIHDRRKRAFTAWYIQPNTTNRRDLLSGHNTWCHLGKPLLMRHLPLMKCANIANSMFNRLAYQWIKYVVSVLNLFTVYSQLSLGQLNMIKTRGIFDQSLIAALPYIL